LSVTLFCPEPSGSLAVPTPSQRLRGSKELSYYSYMFAPDNPLAALYGQPVWEADYTGRETDRVQFEGEARLTSAISLRIGTRTFSSSAAIFLP